MSKSYLRSLNSAHELSILASQIQLLYASRAAQGPILRSIVLHYNYNYLVKDLIWNPASQSCVTTRDDAQPHGSMLSLKTPQVRQFPELVFTKPYLVINHGIPYIYNLQSYFCCVDRGDVCLLSEPCEECVSSIYQLAIACNQHYHSSNSYTAFVL